MRNGIKGANTSNEQQQHHSGKAVMAGLSSESNRIAGVQHRKGHNSKQNAAAVVNQQLNNNLRNSANINGLGGGTVVVPSYAVSGNPQNLMITNG